MTESNDSKQEALFPTLTAAQIARLASLGVRRKVAAGEVLFEQGAQSQGLFVVIEGSLEVVSPSNDGEIRLTVHDAGQFTGEINMLAGRPTLVRTRAAAASELLEIDPPT